MERQLTVPIKSLSETTNSVGRDPCRPEFDELIPERVEDVAR